MKINKILGTLGLGIIILGSSGCNKIKAIDYSKTENWNTCECSGDKEIDTFFIYPTVTSAEVDLTTIEDNRKCLEESGVVEYQASLYTESTNLFIPLYRQISFLYAYGCTNQSFIENLHNHQAYKDITNSLDYYFEHFNNNKPFILAGHSQGSAMLFNVLTDYMQVHPEYLSRMVACYAIGYGFSKTEIAKYPSLKFATGETDTNCIISYNTFGPNHAGPSILHTSDSYCINPINWKTDGTFASRLESKGSCLKGTNITSIASAMVDTENGCLITDADSKYEVKDVDDIFGTHTFHEYDYSFYFQNLKENVAKRIQNFSN